MEHVALITGAARGLGRATAEKFLRKGWFVIATDVDDLSMAWLIREKNALVVKMDVASDQSVAEAFSRISKTIGKIGLVINNAGIDRYFPLSETPVNRFREVFEVNVFGAYRVTQVFLPLLQQPGGRIIFIGSESLNLTVPFMPYPLSKRLLEGYARVIRSELRFSGIDVVVVRPGAIDTVFLDGVRELSGTPVGGRLDSPFRKFAATAGKEIGKTLAPGEAASFIFRVAGIKSPAACYRINNQWQLRIAAMMPYAWFEKVIHSRLK